MRRILVPIRTRTIEIEIPSDLNSDEMSGRAEKKAFLKMAGDKNCPRKEEKRPPPHASRVHLRTRVVFCN